MRRRVAALIVGGLLGTAVPLVAGPVTDAEPAVRPAAVAVHRVGLASAGVRDEMMMILVGTALFGLAAAVRRAG